MKLVKLELLDGLCTSQQPQKDSQPTGKNFDGKLQKALKPCFPVMDNMPL